MTKKRKNRKSKSKKPLVVGHLLFFHFLFVVCCLLSAIVCLYATTTIEFDLSSSTTHNIKWGDTLAKISYNYYGDGKLYPKLAEINQLKNPHLIIAGKKLIIPRIKEKAPNMEPPVSATLDINQVLHSQILSSFQWRKITNNTFSVGEKLKFDIRWQFITAGTATLEISEIIRLNDRDVYKIISTARSTPFIDTFYKVRDINISYMDVESICSHRFESDIQEGNYKKKETIDFDQTRNTFTISNGKQGTTSPFVQDVLSSLYYTRLQELNAESSIVFDVQSGDKTYPLVVRVLGREKIKVPAGEFECFKLEPQLRGEGIFKAKGKLWVWLTTDNRRLPVLMKSKILIGSIEAVLVEYNY